MDLIYTEVSGVSHWEGVAGEDRPEGQLVGSTIKYTNGDVELWSGSQWIKIRTGGADHTVTQAGSILAYGTYPVYQPLPFAGLAAATTDGLKVYESGDVSAYNKHEFSSYVGTGADTLTVLVMHLGQTTYETIPVQVVDRSLVVGAVVQSVADVKAVGNYTLYGQFKAIKILQNGASISAAYGVRGAHEVS